MYFVPIPDGASEYLDVVLQPGAQLLPVGEVVHQQDLLQQLARRPEAIIFFFLVIFLALGRAYKILKVLLVCT
jgi:hypothetical protein